MLFLSIWSLIVLYSEYAKKYICVNRWVGMKYILNPHWMLDLIFIMKGGVSFLFLSQWRSVIFSCIFILFGNTHLKLYNRILYFSSIFNFIQHFVMPEVNGKFILDETVFFIMFSRCYGIKRFFLRNTHVISYKYCFACILHSLKYVLSM